MSLVTRRSNIVGSRKMYSSIVGLLLMLLMRGVLSFHNSALKSVVFGRRTLDMKIIRLSSKTMRKLVPKSISNDQWKSYWGLNDLERLKKAMESLLVSYGGGWLVWLLSFQVGSFISGIVGTLLIFNWIYTPILNARRRSGTLLPRYKKLHYALFEGEIADISRVKRRAGKTVGAASQEFLTLHVEDETGCQLEILTQWQAPYTNLRKGMHIVTTIASSKSSFADLACVTDSWVPSADVWVGDYPYLDKKAFRSIVVDIKRHTAEIPRDSRGYNKYKDDNFDKFDQLIGSTNGGDRQEEYRVAATWKSSSIRSQVVDSNDDEEFDEEFDSPVEGKGNYTGRSDGSTDVIRGDGQYTSIDPRVTIARR